MSGPLPNPERRRRNAPAIPTTELPASGRAGAAPKVPSWVKLGKAGVAWWRWAWKTPQAAAWASGHEAFVAKRASLEDDLAALERVDGLDFAELAALDAGEVASAVRRVASLAAGRVTLLRECREMDDRLGLTPKAMAALRWRVVADDAAVEVEGGKPAVADRRQRLKVV